jgi:ADP-ribose pyrophosphatase YjhB (NUDIX family)
MSGPERFKIPVGIFIMLRQDDKVLLQLRQNCSFSGFWGVVGGHLDGNEQVISAAIREAKEEIGVDIHPDDLILKTICHSNKGEEYLQFYFECCKWSGDIKNKEPNKCERLEWYEWNNTPNNTCPYLKEAIFKINSGISFYEDTF